MTLNELLIQQIKDIVRKFPDIESVMLFGSRAYGDHNDLSDIDLAVKAPKLTDRSWILLTEQIESEVDTLLKIDVVLYDHSTDALREQIDRCHKVLYEYTRDVS